VKPWDRFGLTAISTSTRLRQLTYSEAFVTRLRRDNPVQPKTNELVRKGLAELGSLTGKQSSSESDLHNRPTAATDHTTT
jgi:hypothetical protein